MIEFYIAIVAFIICLGLLVALAITDHKLYILPNKMVAGLAISSIVFHVTTNWSLLSLEDSALGLITGMGLLLVVRTAGNYFLKMEDSVGLGDVKLMGAVGLLLGFPNVLQVFVLGGILGVLHGIIIRFFLLRSKKTNEKVPALSRINIPAGVGLSIATVIIFFYVYGAWWNYV